MNFLEEKMKELQYLMSNYSTDQYENIDNIKIICKKQKNSNINYYLASSIIDASHDDLMHHVCDLYTSLEKYRKISTDTANLEILEETKSSRKLRQINKLPKPFVNREFIYFQKMHNSTSKSYIIMYSITDEPKLPDTTLGEIYISAFIFEKIGDMKTNVTRIICADPKGNIPNYAVNMVTKKLVEDNIRYLQTYQKIDF
jgi:hypothetical protein